MFWNLHCKVATLVQGKSHITLPKLLLLFLNYATFGLSTPFWSKSSLLLHIKHLTSCYLSFYLDLPYLYMSVFLHRTMPVIQPLARGSMLSITTAHPTLHPTWQVTTLAPARPPPPPRPTPSRSHPLASPASPSQRTLQVRIKPQGCLSIRSWSG